MEPEWMTRARSEGRVTERGVNPAAINPEKGELDRRTLLETLISDGVKVSEKQFQQAVIALAQRHGWKVAHFEKVPIAHGKRVTWATPVKADGAGFPDLELVRERLIKAELKVGKNKTTPEQDAWLRLYASIGVEWYVWRPEDWEVIRAILTQRKD